MSFFSQTFPKGQKIDKMVLNPNVHKKNVMCINVTRHRSVTVASFLEDFSIQIKIIFRMIMFSRINYEQIKILP